MRLCRNRVAATPPQMYTKPDTPNPLHLPATHKKVQYKRVSTSHICTPKPYAITENQLQHTSVLLHNWHTIRSWHLSSNNNNKKATWSTLSAKRKTEAWTDALQQKPEEGSPKPNTNFPGFTTEKEMGGCHNTLKANQGEINTSV